MKSNREIEILFRRLRLYDQLTIDQYAEKALGNRDYFLNKPYGVG